MRTFVIAGGCFWCLDAVYRTLKGVTDVISGYTGGTTAFPSYESVCTGTTGHAEAVKVVFDETVIPESVILDVFFTLHDPRQLNRQGMDVGTQYRSAMFYADEQQKQLFEAARDRATSYWEGDLVTTLEPLGEYYDAEDYHLDFYDQNRSYPYCRVVIDPKIEKLTREFGEKIGV